MRIFFARIISRTLVQIFILILLFILNFFLNFRMAAAAEGGRGALQDGAIWIVNSQQAPDPLQQQPLQASSSSSHMPIHISSDLIWFRLL